VQRNALIRKLPAVETLGAATFICTDKTGTLTENAMTVREIAFLDRIVTVTGEGFSTAGDFRVNGKVIQPRDDESLKRALEIGALCNSSDLQAVTQNEYRVLGDPTEGALLIAAAKAGLWEEFKRAQEFVAELPFDSTRKRMTIITRQDDAATAFVKGELLTVLPLCTHIQRDNKIEKLDDAAR